MDALSRLEVYIPVEAEVKSVPLRSLPNSVLKRIGLPLPDSEASNNLADSPKGIWICPVVLRKKGQKKSSSHTDSGVRENLSSTLGTEFRTKPGPFRMAFVASNRAAYKVLKDIPGTTASQAAPLPHSSAPRVNQDSVVIYCGRIYLSIKKHDRSQNRRKVGQELPLSAVASTSDVTSKSTKDLPKKTHSHGNKEKVPHKRRVASSSKIHSQPTLPASSQCHKEARGEPASEPMGDETQELFITDAQSTDQYEGPDISMQAEIQGSAQNDFDFNALEQEEKIARLKAILRQDEAAVKNLPSYK